MKKKILMISLFFLLIFILLPFVNADLTDGLVIVWKFDNATTDGSVCIDSLGRNNGTITTAVTGEDCKIGQCYKYNNDGSNVDSNNNIDITGTMDRTICTWVLLSGFEAGDGIVTWGFYAVSTRLSAMVAHEVGAPNSWGFQGKSADRWATTPILNNWHFLCIIINNTGQSATLYQNGSKVSEGALSAQIDTANTHLFTGIVISRPDNDFDGWIDETYIWNRTLNSGEISDLWNNGDGYEYPFAVPSIVYNLSLILTDRDYNNLDYPNDELLEHIPFYIFANFTEDNLPFASASCNFTGINISSHFSLRNTNNYTLIDGDSQLDLIISENPLNLVNDLLEFEVCRTNIKEDMQIYINGSLYEEIDKNSIPLCDVGLFHYINTTTEFNSDTSLNISLQCDNCDGVNRQLIIILDELGELLHFERHFSEHSENMVYNSTSELYQYIDYLYHYEVADANLGNITLNCDNNITETVFNVVNVNLTIDIVEINGTDFSDGVELSRGNNISIIIDVHDDIISFLQFNITTANSSLITTNDNFINLLTSDVLSIGRYNISVWAVDNEGFGTGKTGWFIVNDTTFPFISMVYPKSDNSSSNVNTGSITINFTAVDDADLYIINWNITEVSTGDLKYNQTLFISGLSYNVIQSVSTLNWTNATYFFSVKSCDSHTKKEMKKAKSIIKSSDSLKYQFGNTNINIKSLSGFEESTHTKKLKDRYTFKFKYSESVSIKKYELTSNKKITYLPNSEYKGHFIIDDTYWIDFEQEEDVIAYLDNGEWIIEIDNPSDELEFNSIGELNCINAEATFVLLEEPILIIPLLLDFDLSNLQNVMILFLIGFLWIALMSLGFLFKNFGFASFGFFMGLVMGFMLSGVHIVMTIIFWILNIVMFIKYSISFR